MPNSQNIMLIYGHCEPLNSNVRIMLRNMGLWPLGWNELVMNAGSQTGSAVHNLDVVTGAFDQVQAVVAILYGEEEVKLIPKLTVNGQNQLGYQPRPNVIFEVGMALRIMPNRTFLLKFGPDNFRVWSDIHGLDLIDFTRNEKQKRQELFLRLKNVGCAVNQHSADFMADNIKLKCDKSILA